MFGGKYENIKIWSPSVNNQFSSNIHYMYFYSNQSIKTTTELTPEHTPELNSESIFESIPILIF